MTARARAGRVLLVVWIAAAVSCGHAGATKSTPTLSNTATALRALDAAQFLWVSTECVDGGASLAQAGFERRLSTEVHGTSLRFTYDTELPVAGCASTEVWALDAAPGGQWTFSPEAVVTQPAGVACGAPIKSERGVVRMTGDTLQELRFASPWCRGYDVLSTYLRVSRRLPDSAEIVRRYVAHWNRRDADAVARLFAEDGALIEPLSKSDDGAPLRHEGRTAVRSWLRQAFASVPWLALSLEDVQAVGDDGRLVVNFRYMDPRLAEPLRGRYLLVLAAHEVYAAELQLLSEPVPLAAPPASN